MLAITKLSGKKGISAISKYYTESIQNPENNLSEYYSENREIDIIDKAETLNGDESIEEILAKGKATSRIGYDLQLSVDKTLSIAEMVLDKQEIKDAIKEGVKTVINEVDKRLYAREVIAGTQHHTRYVRAKGVYIAFYHELSRAGDPSRHVHIVALNKGKRETDGKMRAVEMARVFQDRYLIDLKAQLAIAKKLQEKGLNIYFKDGAVRLNLGEKEEHLRTVFSKRKEDIKTLSQEIGVDYEKLTRKQKNILALMTRKDKSRLKEKELKEMWKKEFKNITSYEETKKKINQITKYGKTLTKEDIKKAIMQSIEELSENESVFDISKVEERVYKKLQLLVNEERRKIISINSINKLFTESLHELEKDKYLHTYSASLKNRDINITKLYLDSTLRIEKENVTIAKKMKNSKFTISEDTIKKEKEQFEKEKGFNLSDDQNSALSMLQRKGQIALIEGDAGTGKTTVMEVVKRIADREGKEIFGVAPTGAAADQLKKALSNAETVDSFLMNKTKVKNGILIVDEAGTLSARKLNALLKNAEKNNTKIILVGDEKQFQSVEAGNVLADLKDAKIPYARLTTIRRQKNAIYHQLTSALSRFDFNTASEILIKHHFIYDAKNRDDALKRIKADFLRDHTDSVIITKDNATKDQLNREIRAELGKGTETVINVTREKKMSQADLLDASKYEVGDIIKIEKKPSKIKSFLKHLEAPYHQKNILGKWLSAKGERYKEFIVKNVDIKENKIEVIDEKTGITETFTASDFLSIFKTSIRSIYRKEQMEITSGDRVMTLKNDRKLGVKNGEIFQIQSIKDGKVVLSNEEKTVTIDPKNYSYLDYAYAMTGYKSQGMTVNHVLYYAEHSNFNEAYVALTRGKKSARVYTENAVSFLYDIQKLDMKETTQTQKIAQTSAISHDTLAKRVIEKALSEQNTSRAKKYLRYINSFTEKTALRQRIEKNSEEQKKVADQIRTTIKTQQEAERQKQMSSSLTQ